jgi:hypothetical protein
MAEMELQNEEIAEGVKRLQEEEAVRRHEQDMKEEEVRNIKKRLLELGYFPPPMPVMEVEAVEDEGEDEVQDEPDSDPEDKPVIHKQVSFLHDISTCIIMTFLELCLL